LTEKPSGIDERPDQLRPPIIKSEGVTASERYLASLAEKSFLNLWSYPSPYRDQKTLGVGDGKELCDLLVVCGQHIIVFSEKTIEWPSGAPDVAWCRWAKRAIQSSAKQAKGAERWINEHPQRVYLDRECTVSFPISFPSIGERIFHRVIVARGGAHACKEHFGTGSGSMVINPSIVADAHWSSADTQVKPFEIGDIDPEGSFVHVLDEVALDIALSELDTVRDFTDYLLKRADFIRSGKLKKAHGEENLLAYYAIRINQDGDHDFVLEGAEPIVIDRNQRGKLISNPQYIAKKQEDKVSYLWDMLIEVFTNHMLNGTSITLDDFEYDIKKNELGVRFMALESRFHRRALGQAVLGALEEGRRRDRFFCVVIATPESKNNETAFFIQTMKYLDWMETKGGYEHYRRKRAELAIVYAKGLLERYPHLKRVVGISREPPDQGKGVSEDLIYAEQSDWSEEARAAILADCKAFGVLQELKERRWSGEEFPEVTRLILERSPSHPAMNRQQRRASNAKKRKSQK
jgi:hypothetical protein